MKGLSVTLNNTPRAASCLPLSNPISFRLLPIVIAKRVLNQWSLYGQALRGRFWGQDLGSITALHYLKITLIFAMLKGWLKAYFGQRL